MEMGFTAQHPTEVGKKKSFIFEKDLLDREWSAKGNTNTTEDANQTHKPAHGGALVFGSVPLFHTPSKQNTIFFLLAPVEINNLCYHGDVDPNQAH